MTPLLADFGDSFWLPTRASTYARGVDSVFAFILWLSVFFFVLVVLLMVVFVVRYRQRRGAKGQGPAGRASHNTALELTWTIIPTILVVIIFLLGHRAYVRMAMLPPGITDEIDVTASTWNWLFTYQPSGYESSELHLPLGVPIRLVLRSNDVIHGFFIPDFRFKKDVVPGRETVVSITATKLGTFDLYCSQYCGTQHSTMLASVIVHDPDDYQRWLKRSIEEEKNFDPVAAGRLLYQRRGCAQCHTVDGSTLAGPSFRDLFGSTQRFTDGSSAVIDEPFIRQFVRSPQARIPVGFEPLMQPFTLDALSEKDLSAIVAYMRSISAHAPRDAATRPSTTTRPAATTLRPD